MLSCVNVPKMLKSEIKMKNVQKKGKQKQYEKPWETNGGSLHLSGVCNDGVGIPLQNLLF